MTNNSIRLPIEDWRALNLDEVRPIDLIATAHGMGLNLTRGLYYRPRVCCCAAGALALYVDSDLFDSYMNDPNRFGTYTADIASITGLSVSTIRGISDGFEDVSRFTTIGEDPDYDTGYRFGVAVAEAVFGRSNVHHSHGESD